MTDFQIALVSTIIGAFIGLVVSIVTYKKARKHDKETASCELFNQLMKDVFVNIANVSTENIIKDIMDEKLSHSEEYLKLTKDEFDEFSQKVKENTETYRFFLLNINSTCKQLKRDAADKDTFAYLFNDIAHARIMQRIYNILEVSKIRALSQDIKEEYLSYYSKEIEDMLYVKSKGFILNTKDNTHDWNKKFADYEKGVRYHMKNIFTEIIDNIIKDYSNNKSYSKYLQLLKQLDGYGFKERIIVDSEKKNEISKYFDDEPIIQNIYSDLINYNNSINSSKETKLENDRIINKYLTSWN